MKFILINITLLTICSSALSHESFCDRYQDRISIHLTSCKEPDVEPRTNGNDHSNPGGFDRPGFGVHPNPTPG